MSAPNDAIPDVTEMAAIHRVFRGAFDMGPRLVASAPAGDASRVDTVASYFRNVLEFLHVHHSSEDLLVFPRLRERTDQDALIGSLDAQHDAVDAAAQTAREKLERWAATSTAEDSQGFSAAWSALGDVLTQHMDDEEELASPLIEQHITLEEWQELPGHAMAAFQGDNIFLILGLVRDQMTQNQRDRMLEEMPPPAADAWRNLGITAYTTMVKDLMTPAP